jgi:hypothetical protein
MLNNVPKTVNKSARIVVLRHPNAMDCQVWRKVVNRPDEPAAGGGLPVRVDSLPTIGGLGSTSKEDEADIDYELLGDAKAILTGIFAGNSLMDADDAIEPTVPQQEALVESVDAPESGGFVVDKDDLVLLTPGGGVVLPFEVVDVIGTVNVPPYTRKFVLQPRDNLYHIPGLSEVFEERPELPEE